MAYKFQLGKARMSGALEQEGNFTVETGSSHVIGVTPVFGSPQYFAQMKYDGVLDAGFFQLASGSGETVFEVGAFLSGSVMDVLAGNGLAFAQGSGELSVGHDNSTIEISSDQLRVKDGGITNAKLAGLNEGHIKVGNSSNVAADVNAKGSGQILIGDGTTLNSVAVTGDVFISAAGATSIQNDKVGVAQLKSSEFAQGSIIRGDSSGDPQIFALGAANRILQSIGS